MYGNKITKTFRVLDCLLTHPSLVSSYIKYSLNSRITPLDVRLPWWSYSAINAVQEHLYTHRLKTGFEFGLGGSSVWLKQSLEFLNCIETDAEWAKLLKESSNEISISIIDGFNEEAILDGAYRKNYLSSCDDRYDLIVVDGQDFWSPGDVHTLRVDCFYHAEKHVNDGGIIIVDDSWRYPVLRENNSAKTHRICQSVGPCRKGVTSTDIYYY